MGLTIPEGFTTSADLNNVFKQNNESFPRALKGEEENRIGIIEKTQNPRFIYELFRRLLIFTIMFYLNTGKFIFKSG